MAEYRVRWEVDVEANGPEEAAREAFKIQRDPTSIATVFQVSREVGSNKEGEDPVREVYEVDLCDLTREVSSDGPYFEV